MRVRVFVEHLKVKEREAGKREKGEGERQRDREREGWNREMKHESTLRCLLWPSEIEHYVLRKESQKEMAFCNVTGDLLDPGE
jgi:hypothetical protein